MERSYKVYTSVYFALFAIFFCLSATLLSDPRTVCFSDFISVLEHLHFTSLFLQIMYDFIQIHDLSFLFPRLFHEVVILYMYYALSRRTLAEDTMMQLSMAHGLTGNAAYLKAKVGCLLKNNVYKCFLVDKMSTKKQPIESRYNEPQNEQYPQFSPAKVTVKLRYNEHIFQAPQHVVRS